ncbi:MAG: TldD/PmbA family protein [Aquificaceae bacterium]
MEDIKYTISKYIEGEFEYEIYVESVERTLVETSDEKLENVSRSKEMGVGIRVLKGSRIGFAYTSDIRRQALRECVTRAIEICNLMPEDEGFCFNCNAHLNRVEDKEDINMSVEDRVELLVYLEKLAKSMDNRIRGVRKTSLEQRVVDVYCYNSCGLEYSHRSIYYTSSMSILAEYGDDSSISYGFRGARRFKSLDIHGMVKDTVFKATSLLNPTPYETKTMPVIFFREAFAMLLEAFSPAFLGDSLVGNKTPLKDKVGEPIASKMVCLIDNATLEGGFMSYPYDAEGAKARKNMIIENGVFRGFLHSLYTSKKLREDQTGNSVRSSYKNIPTSGITNLYVEKGSMKVEDMIKVYDEVFLVLDLMGLHTSDPVSGDFSLGASGIIYKGGKEKKSVRGITISGNVWDVFKNVICVGEDLAFYANVGSPSLIVERLTVGA